MPFASSQRERPERPRLRRFTLSEKSCISELPLRTRRKQKRLLPDCKRRTTSSSHPLSQKEGWSGRGSAIKSSRLPRKHKQEYWRCRKKKSSHTKKISRP